MTFLQKKFIILIGVITVGVLLFIIANADEKNSAQGGINNGVKYEDGVFETVSGESASLADGIYVDQPDHFKNGEEPEAEEEHEGENHDEHEGHDHD